MYKLINNVIWYRDEAEKNQCMYMCYRGLTGIINTGITKQI